MNAELLLSIATGLRGKADADGEPTDCQMNLDAERLEAFAGRLAAGVLVSKEDAVELRRFAGLCGATAIRERIEAAERE